MIEIDIDSNQFGGFSGVRSPVRSASCFTVTMQAVPRVGETIYVKRTLMPEICFTGEHSPQIESEGQYEGFVALEVIVVTHRMDESGHRPLIFCQQRKSPFT